MKLPRPRISEIHSVYIDSLEDWIDIPVFDEGDVKKLIAQINWDGLSLNDYKRMLIDTIELDPRIKSGLGDGFTSRSARNEVYDYIINKNPALQPKNAINSEEPLYNAIETRNVMEWFASKGVKGRPPEVISGEVD